MVRTRRGTRFHAQFSSKLWSSFWSMHCLHPVGFSTRRLSVWVRDTWQNTHLQSPLYPCRLLWFCRRKTKSKFESPAVAMVTNVTGNASNTPHQISPAIFNVTPQYFQPMQQLPVLNVPKSNTLTHPERRILRVKRPSLRQKSAMYEKDEVDELAERMSFLKIGSNVPKTLKSGSSPWGLFGNGIGGGNSGKRSVFVGVSRNTVNLGEF